MSLSIKDAGGGSSRLRAPQRRYIFGVLFAALCVICGFIIFGQGDFQEASPARETDRTVAAPPMATPQATDVSAPAAVGASLVIEPPGAPGPDDKTERLLWLRSLQDWGMQNPLAASTWAIENLSPEECLFFLGTTGGIAFQLGAKDMQQGLLLLQNLKKWDGQKVDAGWEDGETMYSALMAKFAAGAVASDPAKAIELAREFGSLYELAGHWAKLDVQQATQWARSLTDAVELDRVVEAITSALVNNNRDRGVMVDWVNSLVESPAGYDKAVTTMLEQLPRDALGPMLEALLVEPPPDAGLALALIRGIGGGAGRGGNRYAEGPLRGELLQQIASGLDEGLLNNAEVQLALNNAYFNAARTMRGADAVNYLASGGGVIPEARVAVANWSPAWQEWASESPAEAIGWLTETRPAKDQVAVVEEVRKRLNDGTVFQGIFGGESYQIAMDNQGVFLLKVEPVGSEAAGQQFTYINGQWVPPLPEKWQREHIDTPIKERMNLRSALNALSPP